MFIEVSKNAGPFTVEFISPTKSNLQNYIRILIVNYRRQSKSYVAAFEHSINISIPVTTFKFYSRVNFYRASTLRA